MNNLAKAVIAILVMAMTPLAHGQILQTLHVFGSHGTEPYEGRDPRAALTQGIDGNFYGTTAGGGTYNVGTTFRITPDGTLTTLMSFDNNGDGLTPTTTLLQGTNGYLYGTTTSGGNHDYGAGTVFKMSLSGVQTTLVSFDYSNGAHPHAGLVQGTDGNYYGTTGGGGMNGRGTVFKMTPSGVLTTLAVFNNWTNGAYPSTELLVQGHDGNFYGTTEFGGTNGYGYGTMFRMTTNGTLTRLYSFSGNNGVATVVRLVQGSDGDFYATASEFGLDRRSWIIKVTTNGAPIVLLASTSSKAPLLQGRDGNFYGTTQNEGVHGYGSVFQMAPNGVLTTLASFTGNPYDGGYPVAGLVQGIDGNFYGTTPYAAAINGGTVFRIVMPSLNLKQSGNKLILTWPTNLAGFTLQSSLNLASATNWINSTSSPTVVDEQFTVTNTISGGRQFFRLKK